MKETELLEGRIRELSRLAYERDVLKFTDFLSLSEQAAFYDMKKEELYAEYALFGGYDEAERRLIFFLPSYMEKMELTPYLREKGVKISDKLSSCPGEACIEASAEHGGLITASKEKFSGYPASVADSVISCIKISPLNAKFADELTHRDFLGALMNLGIERSKIGDIITDGETAYAFCMADIRDFVCSELTRVKHTSVKAEAANPSECEIRPEMKELFVNVASERADAVISAVFNLSRNASAQLISSEAVFADGRAIRQSSAILKEGSRISARGFGKFIFDGISGNTRKGRLYIKIRKFV